MPLPHLLLKIAAGLALAGAILCGCPAAAGPLGGILGLPGPIVGGIGQTTNSLEPTLGSTLRAVQRDPVGRPLTSRILDRDEHGARIVRGTVIAIAPTDSELAIAKQLEFEIARTDTLSDLGFTAVQLQAPDGMSTTEALAALRKADPAGTYDYDHVYDPSGDDAVRATAAQAGTPHPVDAHNILIGMIDGGIALRHPAFDDASIVSKDVAGSGEGPATAHGTAIASLLVGQDDDFHGCLPGATLYAADVYGGQAGGGGALEIARALDWLASKNVPVVDISLTGPDNKLLQLAVERFLARGAVIVAAVGNAGPAAPLAYPAAYAGVVGVTSVDAEHHLQLDANRGDVSFAALGVDVRAAKPERGYSDFTGTSFAAPVVAARFALLVATPNVKAAQHAFIVLEKSAVSLSPDAGAYGHGYLGPPDAKTSIAAE